MKIWAFRFCRASRGKPFLVIVFVAAGCLIAGLSAAETIQGTIRYVGAPIEKKKTPVTIDQYICGKEKEPEDLLLSSNNGIRNAVVSLQSVPSGAKRDWNFPAAKMDQQQCSFIPRVVIVPAGGTVEFLNSDRLLHNLHSVGKENPPFNRTQPRGRAIPVTFGKPEIIRVDCDLHSWMRAWVVVADHPFYALSNEAGEFVLAGVPPGTYT